MGMIEGELEPQSISFALKNSMKLVSQIKTILVLFLFASQGALASYHEAVTFSSGLIELEPNKMKCSVVKIHSRISETQERPLTQSGYGWVVRVGDFFGVVAPFHVIAAADGVWAECMGQFFHLTVKNVSVDQDLALLSFKYDNEFVELFKKLLIPLIYLVPADRPSFFETTGFASDSEKMSSFQLINPQLPKAAFASDRELLSTVAQMESFGVALSPNKARPSDSVVLSPDLDLRVWPTIASRAPLVERLIQVNGLGIRPGMSGGALFGIHSMGILGLGSQSGESRYELSHALMPKFILGMVVRTKNNGAETHAVPMNTIVDFIGRQDVDIRSYFNSEGLKLGYLVDQTKETSRLIPFLRYQRSDSRFEEVHFFEICSEEYKISSEIRSLGESQEVARQLPRGQRLEMNRDMNRLAAQLRQALQDSRPDQIEAFKLNSIITNGRILRIDPLTTQPQEQSTEPTQQQMQVPPALRPVLKNLRDSQQLRGGGDYGEGSDGFSSVGSQFLVSDFTPSDLAARGGRNFRRKVVDTYSSLGLYRTDLNCSQKGISFADKILVGYENEDGTLRRLTSFEDLLAIYNLHPATFIQRLNQRAKTDHQMPLLKNAQINGGWSADLDIALPGVTSSQQQWAPGGRPYFSQVLTGGGSSVWRRTETERTDGLGSYRVSARQLHIKVPFLLPQSTKEKADSNAHIELQFTQSNQGEHWAGTIALSKRPVCQIALDSTKMKKINPWFYRYQDEKMRFEISLGKPNEVATLQFFSLDEACFSTPNLALGEIRIFEDSSAAAVIRSHRTLLIPHPRGQPPAYLNRSRSEAR